MEILVTSCCRKQDKLRPDGPLGLYADFTLINKPVALLHLLAALVLFFKTLFTTGSLIHQSKDIFFSNTISRAWRRVPGARPMFSRSFRRLPSSPRLVLVTCYMRSL